MSYAVRYSSVTTGGNRKKAKHFIDCRVKCSAISGQVKITGITVETTLSYLYSGIRRRWCTCRRARLHAPMDKHIPWSTRNHTSALGYRRSPRTWNHIRSTSDHQHTLSTQSHFIQWRLAYMYSYKPGQIFLPFCHSTRVWQTERQTDGRTEFSSLYRVCITCSAEKKLRWCKNRYRWWQFQPYAEPHPLEARNTKVCMWCVVPDLITPIKFNVDRLGGFRSLGV